MRKKSLFLPLLMGTLIVGSLTGCNSSSSVDETKGTGEATTANASENEPTTIASTESQSSGEDDVPSDFIEVLPALPDDIATYVVRNEEAFKTFEYFEPDTTDEGFKNYLNEQVRDVSQMVKNDKTEGFENGSYFYTVMEDDVSSNTVWMTLEEVKTYVTDGADPVLNTEYTKDGVVYRLKYNADYKGKLWDDLTAEDITNMMGEGSTKDLLYAYLKQQFEISNKLAPVDNTQRFFNYIIDYYTLDTEKFATIKDEWVSSILDSEIVKKVDNATLIEEYNAISDNKVTTIEEYADSLATEYFKLYASISAFANEYDIKDTEEQHYDYNVAYATYYETESLDVPETYKTAVYKAYASVEFLKEGSLCEVIKSVYQGYAFIP